LLAAYDEKLDVARLNKIPAPPFNEKKIPIELRNNIGIRAYPTVLIILYRGIV